MDNKTKMDTLAKEVSKLSALLNDRHPELKSWQWLVEHQCIEIVGMMIELNLLDGEIEEQ